MPLTRRNFERALALPFCGAASGLPAPAAPAPSRASYVESLELFDSDVYLGPRLLDAERPIIGPPLLTAGDMLRELDHYGIREALLFHSAAKAGADPTANRQLLDAIRKAGSARQRLHACWSIVPGPDHRLPGPERVLADLANHGLRAARVFPFNHQYRLQDLGEIPAALAERRVPLLVDFGITMPHHDRTDWNAVEWLLRQHPRLDLVLCHPPSRQNHRIFALMELSRRFHLSTAGFRIHQEVFAMARLFGAESIIYGSHLPYYTAAAPIAEIVYSELSEAEQKQIAGGALRSLLGSAKP